MNPVEIEEAVARLAELPFDPQTFPFAFLEAFGNKPTTIKKLQSGSSNQSDLPGGLLQRNNIHMKVCPEGVVPATLAALRASPATLRYKAKFILATDGHDFEAENLLDGETVACDYVNFHEHFGFFLPLAGITTVKQIRENAFDIKATGRLNRLYIELLKQNPGWDTPERQEDLNHFMARLIFCFFAENTGIFPGERMFSKTIEQMSASDASHTAAVLAELFRAMRTPIAERAHAPFRPWAKAFPYVNGGLFSGAVEVPRLNKMARSYLLHVGALDWTKINPDIFGSMIQAVADHEERGALGMHYTSVPNILKVLNPLFLDDLRAQLAAAGQNVRKLLNLRQRMSRIRVFDPACGSGNFLVIAYKELRAIEAEINRRRGEPERRSAIPLTNFRGIELRHFAAEIARLALVIAKFQCDVLYLGQQEARLILLPLEKENWITCGNALRLDWLSLCPPTGTDVKVYASDMFSSHDQTEIDFENEGGETYICGNPPYRGSKWQTSEQKADLKAIFDGRTKSWKSLDYVAGWFMKAADYGTKTNSAAAFVSTNSICQGQQVPILWPLIFKTGNEIAFAHTSFKWANLASHNAGVTVVIVGISTATTSIRRLYTQNESIVEIKEVQQINAYLVGAANVEIRPISEPLHGLNAMQFGNHPYYGSALIFSRDEARSLLRIAPDAAEFIRPLYGSKELIDAAPRACLWIPDDKAKRALSIEAIAHKVQAVKRARISASKDASAQKLADVPYRFREQMTARYHTLVIPRVSSENRPYLPVDLLEPDCIIQEKAFAMYDAPLWNMALIASRLHWVWIGTVCVRMRTDFSYSNTLGWNTFPVPTLTAQNQADMTYCAEEILLAREHYFPATIADMYDPQRMASEFPLVREAHERNDEVIERIYIGRRFKNDSERLEKLFDLYSKMTKQPAAQPKADSR
ncbi:class I SAM-dependent DNA methyltransferase [Candidatus Viridilinea mediisalina]|uniref:site-specific DNA-methyltransferase (adenine-specific) n=1 Tax=Candidatus Viridilinea mediisalina TaxID=2024553 RepID=A0A2A6RM43_9CHLR|nr:DNA methyltransferase [Candidatus Viridilinea mediisalina]PDW03929.1 lactate dehydrogenase [Candidatus Viridilinea mediisalina]